MNQEHEPIRHLRPPQMKPMTPGDVVFFKRARGGLGPQDRFAEFQGHAFGILIGHVPSEVGPPPLSVILRGMATCGFISFDEIIELMGREFGDELARKFGEKYYGKDAIVTGPPPAEAIVQIGPAS